MLTNTVDLATSGMLTLVTPLATRQIRSAVAANLEVLKQILERAGNQLPRSTGLP